jgi:lysyl-tRNA synthetase class 2
MTELNDLIAPRLEKLKRLKDRGVNPYPYRFPFTHRLGEVLEKYAAAGEEESTETVSVCGRMVAWRDHGKSSFAHIEDATGKLQVYFKLDVVGETAYAGLKDLDIGDFVGLTGKMFRTRTKELTVKAATWEILGKSLRPMPEKWHGLTDVEIRYRHRHLDLAANPLARDIFRIRAAAIRSFREFLDSRGYLEVETPILQSLYGGAEATPFVTRYESLDTNFYLRISNELFLKRLLVGGLDRVYEFAKDFRNEGIDRSHSPEFTLLELYQSYADYGDMMALTEEMLLAIVKGVNAARNRLTGLTDAPGIITYGTKVLDFTKPWPRIRFCEALNARLGYDCLTASDADLRKSAAEAHIHDHARLTRPKLLDKLFSELVQEGLDGPVFVTDHPIELSPLCKSHRSDPRLAERFEPIIACMEVGNAFSELNDPAEQRRRFESQQALKKQGDAEAHVLDENYLEAMECGMPPAGGLGIGLDRLVMLLTNSNSIRDVVLFPQLRPEPREGA